MTDFQFKQRGRQGSMELQFVGLLLLTHGLPIVFFTYMATDVLLRNKRRPEHILVCLISVCYLLMFVEEYVRHQVSIDYSPLLSGMWLSSFGILIPGLYFHFLIKILQLEAKVPRYLYPYVFYLPVPFVFYNLMTGTGLISAHQFQQQGIWYAPIYNTGYYITMIGSVLIHVLYLIPLALAWRQSTYSEPRSVYKWLLWGTAVSLLWHILFGLINFGGALPPYPYLYGGIVWCYFLKHIMKKHDFLNYYDKRFEKLFELHPEATLLMDREGRIKNANSGAQRLFANLRVEQQTFWNLFQPELHERILAREQINRYETVVLANGQQAVLLVHADYVWIDNSLHVLVVLRDITVHKRYEDEIRFLAYHDSLTRLPNRHYFQNQLEEAIHIASRNDESIGLLLIDLDKLKLLNDTYGHLAGDEALQKAASIMQEAVHDKGMAARMGGDEFILFISGSPTSQEIDSLIENMRSQFTRFMTKYGQLPMDMSIGVSFYPKDGADPQSLINIADQAMFQIKHSRVS